MTTGHSMYKAFITTEALLNNPVVNAFVELAMSTHSQGSTDANTHVQSEWSKCMMAGNTCTSVMP